MLKNLRTSLVPQAPSCFTKCAGRLALSGIAGTMLVLGSSTQASAQVVTPESMTFSNSLRLDTTTGFSRTTTESVTFSGPELLSGATINLAADIVGAPDFIMQSEVYAFWNNASEDSGTVRFRHGGLLACASEACVLGDAPLPGGTFNFTDRWSYSFTANENANFNFTYNLQTGGGEPIPFPSTANEFRNPFAIMQFGPSGCIACDGATFGSGTFNYALSAGQSYTFNLLSLSFAVIDPLSGLSAPFGPGIVYADDLFSYSIIAIPAPGIPEPATWAMMIAGFGMVGAGMRRRKVTPALA